MTLSEPLTGPLPGPPGPGAAAAGPGRQWRREALSALGDDPRRRPPVVDGYAVGRLLGAGGSSVVWAGTGADGVERALKVVSTPAAGDGDRDGNGGGADLLAELALLRRVRHPRVVAVHDISTTAQGRPVLVLDLAAGGSLAGVLAQRRRLSAGEVSGLLHVLGPALEDLHAAGVVHGDVAPGNVLLDARGEPLLADLGVSRALGRRHGSVLGTPGFADPAALAGEGVGAAADVYGLAALAWWALTGETPAAAGALGARQAHRRAVAGLPAGGAAVLTALREGLHRKPSRRPTPGELASAVTAAARPRPVRGLAVPGTARVPQDPPPGVTRRVAGSVAGPEAGPEDPGAALGSGTGTGSPVVPAASRPPALRRATPGRGPVRAGGVAGGRGFRGVRGRRLLLAAAALPVVAGAALLLALHDPGPGAAGTAVAPADAVQAPVAVPGAAPEQGAPAQEVPVQEEPAQEEPAQEAPGQDAVLRGDDALAVVTALADRRAAALSSRGAGALDAVDVPGSAAQAADEAVLADLTASGATFEALAFDVRAVRELERTADRWVLEADVTTAEHVVVSAAGARATVPAGDPRTSRLTLERVEGEWRVSAVG